MQRVTFSNTMSCVLDYLDFYEDLVVENQDEVNQILERIAKLNNEKRTELEKCLEKDFDVLLHAAYNNYKIANSVVEKAIALADMLFIWNRARIFTEGATVAAILRLISAPMMPVKQIRKFRPKIPVGTTKNKYSDLYKVELYTLSDSAAPSRVKIRLNEWEKTMKELETEFLEFTRKSKVAKLLLNVVRTLDEGVSNASNN